MPVVIRPSPEKEGRNSDWKAPSNNALLEVISEKSKSGFGESPRARIVNGKPEPVGPESRRIIQSSFADVDKAASLVPYANGLVDGIIRAFEQDLHLVLRPDDIWLGILVQLGLYVKGNAEKVRHLFVAHRGQKELMVDVRPYSVFNFNIGTLAQQMTLLIQDNVVDPCLRDLIMPSFTTTTDNDKSVAAIVMMATLQEYFIYSMRGGCGFPSVTLEGEVSDWREILARVEKLPKYGAEVDEWAQILIPIIKRFITSFYLPDSQETKDFWLHAASAAGQNGSGDIETLSGWLTAFCFWDKDGRRIGAVTEDSFFYSNLKYADRMPLMLDGTEFPMIRRSFVPPALMTVPVLVDDEASGLRYKTTLMAGSVGMSVGSKAEPDAKGVHASVVSPRSGWWMLEDSVEPLPR